MVKLVGKSMFLSQRSSQLLHHLPRGGENTEGGGIMLAGKSKQFLPSQMVRAQDDGQLYLLDRLPRCTLDLCIDSATSSIIYVGTHQAHNRASRFGLAGHLPQIPAQAGMKLSWISGIAPAYQSRPSGRCLPIGLQCRSAGGPIAGVLQKERLIQAANYLRQSLR